METKTNSKFHEIFNKRMKGGFLVAVLVFSTSLFLVTGLMIKAQPSHNSTIPESKLFEEKVIEESVINIKPTRIQPVFKGEEKIVGRAVEIVEGEKVIRKYPNIIQIIKDNETTVVRSSRIKIVE